MGSVPGYIENQAPQDPFDALITRISTPLLPSLPNARLILQKFIESQKAPTYDTSDNPPPSPKPIVSYPLKANNAAVGEDENLLRVQQAIVDELYDAIIREDNTSIDHLVCHNLLTANVTGRAGQTPLLAAIQTKNIGTVKQILGLGADSNMFGQIILDSTGKDEHKETRTPLMLAASLGSLPIVKLLVDHFSADHALIAPDGQIALRLAVENKHQPIVEYLPSLRAGGFLRFKTRNAHNLARAKKALLAIYHFMRFFLWDIPEFILWDIPKLILWDIPKHAIVLPGIRFCKWGWGNRKRFANWCKRQAIEIPKRVWKGIKKIPDNLVKAWKNILKGLKKLGPILWDFAKNIVHSLIDFIKALPETVANLVKSLWKFFTRTLPQWLNSIATWLWDIFTKALPEAVANLVKSLWKFFTRTLPQWLNSIATWLWDIFTKDIPKAIHAALKWIWEVLKSSAEAIWELLSSITSFLHTVFIAIITFLRNATLRDIWNAFCRILRSIFINIPKTLWSWLKSFLTLLRNVLDELFGFFGRVLWDIGEALFELLIYIPKKLWIVLESAVDSIGKAGYEIGVWINPKA